MISSLVLNILAVATLSPIRADSDSISKVINLDEVIVTSSRNRIDDQGSKIVYNAYLEKVRTDVSMTDLMRKIPTLSVDINGNISIKGNSNVRILVNGHSIGILSTSQILEQISPSEVLKVEVMSTPSVKYEAQGTGGIINIITYKKMYFKSSGYLNTGVGTKGSHLMGNFNYAIDKHWTLQNSCYSLISYSSISNKSNFSSGSDGINRGQLYSYQAGATRSNDKSVLNLSLQYLFQNMVYKENQENSKQQKTTSGYHYLNGSFDYSLNINEKTRFDVQSHLFFLPANSRMNRNDYPEVRSDNEILGQITQMDWSLKPIRNLEINTGLSNNYSHFNNRYNTSLIRFINNFGVYYESKYAFTPMCSLTGGVRYEYYYIDTQLKRKRKYHNLFYNVGFDYKFSAFSTFSVLFSHRTDRPTYAALLSNTSYQGGDVVLLGDANIQPSFSYQLESGVSFYIGDCFFKISPYCRYIDHPISLHILMDHGLLQQKYKNLQREYDYGSEFWATLSLFGGKLNFNGGLDVLFKKLSYHGDSNQGVQLRYSMNVTYRLLPSLYVNCYGSWSNKKIYLQGCEDSYLYSNLSLQKNWHNDKFRLAVSFDNPFSNGIRVKRNYDINGIDYYSQTHYHNTGIRLFFVVKFGKHDMEKTLKIKQNILNNY